MNRIPISVVTCLIALAFVGVTGPSSQASAAPREKTSSTNECPTTTLLTFRGSGEGGLTGLVANDPDHLTTDGWEGKMLRRALDSYVDSAANSEHPTALSDTQVIGVGNPGYPAISVDSAISRAVKTVRGEMNDGMMFGNKNQVRQDFSWTLAYIQESARQGAFSAQNLVQDNIVRQLDMGCTRSRYITMGYSQGQMAARLFYTATGSTGIIKGSFAIGDPYQARFTSAKQREIAGIHGGSDNGMGIFNRNGDAVTKDTATDHVDFQKLKSYYSDRKLDRFSLCHKQDPMCDSGSGTGVVGLKTDIGQHESYLDVKQKSNDPAGRQAALDESAQVAAWFLKKSPSSVAGSTPAPTPKPAVKILLMSPWYGDIFSDRSYARLDISGLPAGASPQMDLVPATGDDPWAADLEPVGTFRATPGPYQDDEGYIPEGYGLGTHRVEVPQAAETGHYYLRLRATGSTAYAKVFVYRGPGTDNLGDTRSDAEWMKFLRDG